MDDMFYNCKSVSRIYVSDKWTVKNVPTSTSMFYGCEKLVGGNGTAYKEGNNKVEFACIDSATKKGYLTRA